MSGNARMIIAIVVIVVVAAIAYYYYGRSAPAPVEATQPAATQQTQ